MKIFQHSKLKLTKLQLKKLNLQLGAIFPRSAPRSISEP